MSSVRYYFKIAAGTAAALMFGSVMMRLMDEEHEYNSGVGKFTLSGRKARSTTGSNWFDDHYFRNKDGLMIFYRRWEPTPIAQPQVKGIIIISHGLGEHSGRYHLMAKEFTKRGYAVAALDHQGHGMSEGTRKHVKWFSDFADDVHRLTELMKKKHPNAEKVFLVAHSMGSLIAINSVHKAPRLFDGVVLSAPPLKVELDPVTDTVAPVLASLFPKLPAPQLDLATLCRDPSVVDRYHNDPLNNQGLGTLRLISELVKALRDVENYAEEFPIPYLLLHGSEDGMTMPEGSREFHAKTKVADKKLVIYDGAYHELFNEPDNMENALKHAIEWIEERT